MKKKICAVIAVMLISTISIPLTDNNIAQTGSPVYADSVKISAPEGVKAFSDNSSVTLSWKNVTGAESYRIYIYDSKDKKYKKYRDVNSTTCLITDLKGNKSYYFKVAAIKDNIAGAKSGNVKVFVESKEISAVSTVISNDNVISSTFNTENHPNFDRYMGFVELNNDNTPELVIFDGPYSVYGHCGYYVYGVNGDKIVPYTDSSQYENSDAGNITIVPDLRIKDNQFPVIFLTNKETGKTRYLLVEMYGAATHMSYSITECFFKDGIISFDILAESYRGDGENNTTEEWFKINGKECTKKEFVKFYDTLFDKSRFTRKAGVPLDLMYSLSNSNTSEGFVYSKSNAKTKKKYLLSSYRKAVKNSRSLKKYKGWDKLDSDEYIDSLRK